MHSYRESYLNIEGQTKECQSPLQEGLEVASIGKTSSPDPQIFHQAQILYLVSDQDFIKLAYRKMLCLLTITSNAISTIHLDVFVTHETLLSGAVVSIFGDWNPINIL